MHCTDSIVDEIFSVFGERGHRAYGEDVTELQHALQCATFAQQQGESPEIVASCLLHDYGHLLHDLGEDIADKGVDTRHEHVGANKLSRWFSDTVVAPIRMHADSKRYLCWKEQQYFEDLSAASRQSLELQGGVMGEEEAKQFEQDPNFENAIIVRRYDDMGKIPDMVTPELEEFRELLKSLVLC